MPIADPTERRAYNAQWVFERRERYFREHPRCVDCGGNDGLRLLHESWGPLRTHRIWTHRAALREKELACCVVVCRSCWYKRPGHAGRKYEGIKHGTLSGYKHHKCRCGPCALANRDRVRLQRAKNKAAKPVTTAEDPRGTS